MDDAAGNPTATGLLFRLLDRGDDWLNRTAVDLFGDLPIAGKFLAHHHLSARGLLIAIVGLLALWIVPPSTEWLLRRFRCTATNFRGDKIPQAFGLAVLLCAAPLLAFDAWIQPPTAGDRLLWLSCIVAFAAIGFLDDVRGDKQVKGLRGHLRTLITDRRVTTGLIKAIGGVIIALGLAYQIHGGQPLPVLISAAVIALSANAMNLLDLRPGRACGVFCASAIAILAIVWRREEAPSVPGLLYVVLPALVVWSHDAEGRVMLGDTGSNVLGGSLGLALCLYFGTGVQIVLLLALAALHVAAERISLTKVIEANPVLRAIDRLTGVRASRPSDEKRS